MKDSYPMHLFQVKNTLNKFYISNSASDLYLIIFFIIIRNSESPIQKYYSICMKKKLSENTGLRKKANSSKQCVWFQKWINLVKLINTVIGITQVHRNHDTSFYIGMERLSSHPEEQFFGKYRKHFNDHYAPNIYVLIKWNFTYW